MTKLAAGYLNRAQVARHVKAKAVQAQRDAWPNGHPRNGREIAKYASTPRDPALSGERDAPLIRVA